MLIHGLSSSTSALEPMAKHYRNKGFLVLNIPSPSGKGFLAAPGSQNAYNYLEQIIPDNAIIIGHSYGGNHVEEYAAQRASLGQDDSGRLYITIDQAFATFAYDKKLFANTNILRVRAEGSILATVLDDNFEGYAPYDINVKGGHSSKNWREWVKGLQPYIQEFSQVSNEVQSEPVQVVNLLEGRRFD